MKAPRQPTPPEAILLRFFEFDHLAERLQDAASPFYHLAHWMVGDSDEPSAELTAGLRKLLEAKDCVVRSRLDVRPCAAPPTDE